ncbi:DUF4249 domain-containing protein [Aquimarina gracilis]|uniref:DUF4249 domain-containing protein n=1 Tax=Aquimarina gracilis TaxID=874422 RepID=A0ABU5ZW90_9FLAO|nr:DUF4249 domain-containing protein [Aquimarina gracilis]MEB3346131.1 DUF4249 domain-containing protein [Aquimarina gracilis]
MQFLNQISIYKKTRRVLALLMISVIVSQCVEPFDIETENFEDILVVNATITNEVKHQQILLSRTFRFEDDGPLAEQGATVKVIEGVGTEYLFEELTPGVYTSIQEFAATPGNEYQLSIVTQNNRSYISNKTTLPQETSIDRVYAERTTNNDGTEGVEVFVDTFDPTGNSLYYRYEYEETYRIITQNWNSDDINGLRSPLGPFLFFLTERPEGQRICYNTVVSNNINVNNTTTLGEDRLTRFPVRFLRPDEIAIADRYSILVKQYVQSREANEFYETLSSFSESESLFSQIQPGFVGGNIVSEVNPSEKIIGFFDVSSIATERIFFDREDFVIDLPGFSPDCDLFAPEPASGESSEDFLTRVIGVINSGDFKFFDFQEGADIQQGLYIFVPRECGDCTVFGRSEAPDFWID